MEDPKSFRLAAQSELRFEVDASVTLTLLQGSAEIFGVPLSQGMGYALGRGKYAAFTWYGCELSLEGACRSRPYSASDTPMVSYVNAHGQLEQRREIAAVNQTDGPRVMIVGPTDSGKSSLARILLAYAARRERRPVHVDLDVGQNAITAPGILAAATVSSAVMSVEDGFASSTPLAYFYGHTSPGVNPAHYKSLLRRLATAIDQRLEVDVASRAAGMVINTCGWIEGVGYDILKDVAETLRVDIVLVMGHDRLLNMLTTDLGAAAVAAKREPPTVVKLTCSGGVVQRSPEYRKMARAERVKGYFYGSPGSGELNPSQTIVDWDDVTVLSLVPAARSSLDASLLPVGQQSTLDEVRTETVDIASRELLHSVLALSHAATESADEVLHSNIAGLVYVTHVDVERKQLQLLAPCPGPLPAKLLLQGTLSWVETA